MRACISWADSWSKHLESFAEFATRLPSGRKYARNGSVAQMQVAQGAVWAMVSDKAIYNVRVAIAAIPEAKWSKVKDRCSGKIESLIDMLQGKLAEDVMAVLCHRTDGLFPLPKEITMDCTCPDWVVMCKHVAAVMYSIGNRLDSQPELIFQLRGVKHEELLRANAAALTKVTGSGRRRVDASTLENIFGIEISVAKPEPEVKAKSTAERQKKANSKPTPRSIKTLRKRLKMTVQDFADHLGVSAATVNKWETSAEPLNLQPLTLKALRKAEG